MNSTLLKRTILMMLVALTGFTGHAKDTVYVTAKNINTSVLKEGTHRYLVYFKMGKDAVRSQTQFWTRTIKRSNYRGTAAIEITQAWEDKDSIMHLVHSVSDAGTMQPLYHKTWWKVQNSRNATTKPATETIVDFMNKTVLHNGETLSSADSNSQSRAIWKGYTSSLDQYFLNWHLDLESFPMLPYKKGKTFVIPFYDPGTASGFQQVAYTVMGSAILPGYNDQKIDCWLLVHEEKGNKEMFWVSKKTKEVLKLEQEINGRLYRYKIKLGFSN